MPPRHEREIEEILARAEPLGRSRPRWGRLRLRPPKLPRLRLPSASAMVLMGIIVLLVGLVYGRSSRLVGAALALAGLGLLLAGYVVFVAKGRTRSAPEGRFWRGRALDDTERVPWWRRWRRPRRGK